MNCADIDLLLDDYVDGELGERERGGLESHLSACAGCRGALGESRRLQRAVAGLDRGLTPARDLLPGIREAALSRGRDQGSRGRRLRWIGAAAAVALLAVAAWLALPIPDRVGADVATGGSPGAALAAAELALTEFAAAELEYERATRRLLEILESRQEGLSSETRHVVAENLKIIDDAIAQARAALEADPTDSRNGRALNALHRQKVEVLWRLSRVSS